MRLVQVSVPKGKEETVRAVLEDNDIEYVVTAETTDRTYDSLISFPLPINAVEPILDELRDAGINDKDAYTVVLDVEAVISEDFFELQERYETNGADEVQIAREELLTKAQELSPGTSTYIVMTIFSAVVATAGLLLDSPAIIVGAMVIAPLMGPAISASVGTVIDNQKLFSRGIRLQLAGIGLSVVSATLFSLLVKNAYFIPPGLDITTITSIRSRLTPDFLELVVALAAGAAAAVSLTAGVSTALVGALIAAAVVPPIAIVGIGIAWGLPMVVLGASILVLVNMVSINLSALAVLWVSGYRPEQWFSRNRAHSATIKRIGVLALGILLLSAFLGGVTYDAYQQATLEETVNEEINSLVDSQRYSELELLDIKVEYNDDVLFRDPKRVVVMVGRPAQQPYPELASTLDRRIDNSTDRDLLVQVRFIEISES